jgi:hypothetical protein
MKDIKKELEEIFNVTVFDEETAALIDMINEKLEEVQKNNNEIGSLNKNFEDVVYNLDKLVPEDLKENSYDNKKNA